MALCVSIRVTSSLMLLPVFGRGKFDHILEGARKIKRVFVSSQPGNLFDGEVGSIQKLTRLVKPRPDKVIHRRVTRLVFEQRAIM